MKNKFFTQLFGPFMQKSQQKFCLAELSLASRLEQIAERNGDFYERANRKKKRVG